MNRKSNKPIQLAGESNRGFRLRAVLWILNHFGDAEGMSYDDITYRFGQAWPTIKVAKETIVRDLKILVEREEVYFESPDQDGRRRLWYTYEEVTD